MAETSFPSIPARPAGPALLRDESGQGLTEYALLVAAVATLVISCALLFQQDLSTAVGTVGTHVTEQAGKLGNGRSEYAPGHGNNPPPGQGGVPPGQVGR